MHLTVRGEGVIGGVHLTVRGKGNWMGTPYLNPWLSPLRLFTPTALFSPILNPNVHILPPLPPQGPPGPCTVPT